MKSSKLDDTQSLGLVENGESEERRAHEFQDPRETRARLMREYVGGKNSSFYMSIFHRFDRCPFFPRPTINLPAFLLGILWMAYRKMWLFALLIFPCLFTLIGCCCYYFLSYHLTSVKYWVFNPAIDLSIASAAMLSAIVTGAWGNYFYYLHVLLKVRAVQGMNLSLLEQRKRLAKSGMVSRIKPAVLIVVLLAIALPTGLVLRQYVALASQQIASALQVLNQASDAVSSHVRTYGTWPNETERNNHAFKPAPGSLLGEVFLKEQLIVVTFSDESPVLHEFRGKSLAYFGKQGTQGEKIEWICGAIDLQLAHLPGRCKRSF